MLQFSEPHCTSHAAIIFRKSALPEEIAVSVKKKAQVLELAHIIWHQCPRKKLHLLSLVMVYF
jgi:hypothetical protein